MRKLSRPIAGDSSLTASPDTRPPASSTFSITNLVNFTPAARGPAAETSLTSGSPPRGYTATLIRIAASPASLAVLPALIIPTPDYGVPLITPLDRKV